MTDLADLCRVAVEATESGEAVEAYAEESRRTEAKALPARSRGLAFAESRGVGVRVVRDARLGTMGGRPGRRRGPRRGAASAGERRARHPDEHHVLPEPASWTPIDALFREGPRRSPPTRRPGSPSSSRRARSPGTRGSRDRRGQVGDAVSRIAMHHRARRVEAGTAAPTPGASR